MRCESARGEPAGGSWPSCSAHRLAATSRFLTTASSHMYRLLGLWSSYADADWTGRHRTTSCVCPSIQRRHPTIRSPAKGTEGFTSMWPRRSYETFSQARPYLQLHASTAYSMCMSISKLGTRLHQLLTLSSIELNTVSRTWLDVGGYCSSPVARMKANPI